PELRRRPDQRIPIRELITLDRSDRFEHFVAGDPVHRPGARIVHKAALSLLSSKGRVQPARRYPEELAQNLCAQRPLMRERESLKTVLRPHLLGAIAWIVRIKQNVRVHPKAGQGAPDR